MIPYQMITNFDDLNIQLEKDFFEFEECENVKKFFTILRLKTLGVLNRIYNLQDTAILYEIFESKSALLQKLFKYSAKKSNSTSSFSGCVHRLKSKCKIVLPTGAEILRVFEKTVMGGYSCINTRMAFDNDILLKDTKNEKVLFKTVDGQLKRFSSKIIKMDENNQYGMAMTRPLPYGCIKRQFTVPSFEELEQLLKSVTLEDKIGHIFTVDIEFSHINPKTLLFNEVFPPVFEKHKKIPPHLRSCSQIMSRARKKENKEEVASLPFNSKTHATLNKKIFVNLYAENLYFLTTRAGWKVTKIYDHYTFKQDTFKKDFVVMNQNARKTAKTKFEKDFYKILNNSNFGNDCRNNLGNCKLELLFDGLDEISYIKKFSNVMQDYRYRELFSIELLQEQVRGEFNKKAENLDQDDPFYFSMYKSLCNKLEEDLEAIELFSKRNKKRKFQQKSPIDTIENKFKNCSDI